MTALMNGSVPTDLRAALHEAAHAVVGRAVGLGCGNVGLVADSTRVGFAETERPWLGWRRGDGSKNALIEAYIVTAFAGAAAERHAFGASDGGEWQDEDTVWDAMKHLRIKGCAYVGDEAWDKRSDHLRRRSARLVARFWPTIAKVADALIQRRTLDGDQIDALC